MRTHIRVLVIATLLSATAHGSPEEGASLEQTVGALFRASPAFKVYAVETRDAEAARLGASGAFDLVTGAGVQGQRSLWSAPFGAMTSQGFSDLSLQANLGLRTRENVGLSISGSTPVTSTVDPTVSPDQPQVTGGLTIPLLKLGRAAAFGAEERATVLHAAGAKLRQEDSESALTTQVAQGYWRWVGSFEQVKLTRRLEALANDQLKDVDQLIEQHARAAVDRLPFAAAAESAAATRAQAEQVMLEAGQIVWEMLGLSPPVRGVAPVGELPAVPPAPLEPSGAAQRAHDLARSRPILQAYGDETAAATVRADAAHIGERPDVTLLAQGTALRVENATVLTQTELGYYGIVALQFSFPLQNRTARAAYERAALAREAAALDAAQGTNAIGVRVDTLANELATLTRTYQERTQAADQFRQAYEGERVRFRLGGATGLDVVLAEQQYMNASLAVVGDRTGYAVALARLLHESGALNAAVQSRDPAAVVRRLTNPSL